MGLVADADGCLGLTDGDVALAWLEGTVGVTAMDRWHWRARLVVLGDWCLVAFQLSRGLWLGQSGPSGLESG